MKVNIGWLKIIGEESGITSATSRPQRWRLSVEADGTFFNKYRDATNMTHPYCSALWELEFCTT